MSAALAPSPFLEETVTYVHHWTDRLFTFRCTREPGFRFLAGQFAMIGLRVDGRPLLRAYSMVSAPWDDGLEFLSIKVPNGPLTSRLQHIQVGDTVLIGRKATGTLLLDNLLPGANLWLLGTGTGLAPFLSVIREPATWDRFPKVVLSHTVRQVAELAYRQVIEDLPTDALLGELVAGHLLYLPSVTREDFSLRERITTLLDSGRAAELVGLPPLSTERDRFMLCGSPEMLADTKAWLEAHGFAEGSSNTPGHFVIEKAFVEK